MFHDFYGLTGKPFQLTPDPAFYFRSVTHRKALSYLGYGLAQGEGFIVVTGEVGAGKSTLVAHLMSTVDPQRLVVAQVVTSKLDARSSLSGSASVDWFNSGFAGSGGMAVGYAASLAYYRRIIAGLSGTAAVGLDGIRQDKLPDIMSASALLGLRYEY